MKIDCLKIGLMVLVAVLCKVGLIAADPERSLREMIEKLEPLELRARYFKLEGLLEEGSDGELHTAAELKNLADNRRMAKLRDELNAARHEYAGLLAARQGNPAANSNLLADYARRVAGVDSNEFDKLASDTLFSVQGAPSAMEKLVPAILRAYLIDGPPHLSNVSTKTLRQDRLIYGQSADGRLVSVRLHSSPSAEASRLLAARQCDVAFCEMTPEESRDLPAGLQAVPVADDGVGLIVNPLNPVESAPLAKVSALFTPGKGWDGLDPARRGSVHWYYARGDEEIFAALRQGVPAGATMVSNYEEVDSQVFADPQAVALVPLGVAATTDNKVLRVVDPAVFAHGYRPSALTVSGDRYAWCRRIVLLRPGSGARQKQAVDQLQAFIVSAGRNAILAQGFAPAATGIH